MFFFKMETLLWITIKVIIMRTNRRSVFIKDKFFSFILASFKGISQVFLIEKVSTGLLILLAITISSYYLGIIALLSSLIGTLVAKLGGADENIINQGLFGYNSVVTGMALILFLKGPFAWLIALVGAAIAALFTAAMIHFMKRTEMPVLTFPYIALTWLILLSTYQLGNINIVSGLIPHDLQNLEINNEGIHFIDAIFNGISQIVFLENKISGLLLFVALFLAGRKLGCYAVIGSITAVMFSYALGGEHNLITEGLYGYNAILTLIAVSEVFNNNNRFALLLGIIAACLTIPITAGINIFLLPYGLPVLTMPFVLCSWIFLAVRKVFPNI
ncbi:urea transporter [Niallia endozanthoxylica]|uniref:urea transporter n=1 Tax=Niallia endozanthoxylica TaxID=2036016 RepID=UPI001CC5743B|nr:urea transporter [Niallia endozanthoxylica]